MVGCCYRYYSGVPRGPRPRKTYAEYLNLYYLLDLQRDDENISSDEQHFITVHQIFELWFKLVIRELQEIRDILVAGFVPEKDVPFVVHKLERYARCLSVYRALTHSPTRERQHEKPHDKPTPCTCRCKQGRALARCLLMFFARPRTADDRR